MTTERVPRVTFSPEQQKRVDELIDQAFGRGRHRAAREAQVEIDRLKAEIAALKNKKTFLFWRKINGTRR